MKKIVNKVLIVLSLMISAIILNGCKGSVNSYDEGVEKVKNISVEARLNGEVISDNVIEVFKVIDTSSCYLVNETMLGSTIKKAYMVLKDGTKKQIENIHDFLIDKNIANIEVELVSAVNVNEIELEQDEFKHIFLGNNIKTQIDYNISPANATNQVVKFFSSDESIVSVTNKGELTIKKSGVATITVVTLDGGYKDVCLVKIIDGRATLQNSVKYSKLDKIKLNDSRYDEGSIQQSKFNAVVKNEDVILSVGSKVRNFNELTSIVYLGLPNDSNISKSITEVDPQNNLFSEELYAVDKLNSEIFYACGNALVNYNDNYNGLLTKIVVDGNFVEVEDYKIKENTNDLLYNSLVVVNDRIYVVGIVSNKSNGFINDESNSYGIMHIYDLKMNFIKEIKLDNFSNITKVKYNSSLNELYFCGYSQTGVIGTYNLTNSKIKYGYSSITDGIKYNDIVVTESNEIVVIGQAQVKGLTTGYLQKYKLANDGLSYKTISSTFEIVDDVYTECTFNCLLYKNGILSVLANGKESKSSGFMFFKKDKVIGYSIILNFTEDLKFISGYDYFNGGKGGTIQTFNAAIYDSNDNIIAVGKSNIKESDNSLHYRGYIQYDVNPFNIYND